MEWIDKTITSVLICISKNYQIITKASRLARILRSGFLKRCPLSLRGPRGIFREATSRNEFEADSKWRLFFFVFLENASFWGRKSRNLILTRSEDLFFREHYFLGTNFFLLTSVQISLTEIWYTNFYEKNEEIKDSFKWWLSFLVFLSKTIDNKCPLKRNGKTDLHNILIRTTCRQNKLSGGDGVPITQSQ